MLSRLPFFCKGLGSGRAASTGSAGRKHEGDSPPRQRRSSAQTWSRASPEQRRVTRRAEREVNRHARALALEWAHLSSDSLRFRLVLAALTFALLMRWRTRAGPFVTRSEEHT